MVISPAKTLDFVSPLPTPKHTFARLIEGAQPLARAMDKVGASGIERLMSLSPQLAELNANRFAAWTPEHTTANSRPALCAFDGDVYKGLDAASLGARDFTWAQNHLRILSGLYGLLRPLDLIQPYRLEMGTSIATLDADLAAATSVARYWRDRVTELVIADLPASEPKVLLNLASSEYAAALDTKRLAGEASVSTITPKFCDLVRGQYKVVGFFAKRARGAMAGWVVRQRVKAAKSLTSFDALGYRYEPNASTPAEPLFVRDENLNARAN